LKSNGKGREDEKDNRNYTPLFGSFEWCGSGTVQVSSD